VNIFVLYLLLLKAVMTSFSGMASLPIVRDDLVEQRHVLTDLQLTTAIVAGRTGPGPNGLYLVSVGYFVDGLPGALAGFIALLTPALLVIPLMRWLEKYAKMPRIRGAIRAVVLASAGLLMASSVPMVQSASTGLILVLTIAMSFAILAFTAVESWWVMAGSAAIGLLAMALR
jgi:chromate transporter